MFAFDPARSSVLISNVASAAHFIITMSGEMIMVMIGPYSFIVSSNSQPWHGARMPIFTWPGPCERLNRWLSLCW